MEVEGGKVQTDSGKTLCEGPTRECNTAINKKALQWGMDSNNSQRGLLCNDSCSTTTRKKSQLQPSNKSRVKNNIVRSTNCVSHQRTILKTMNEVVMYKMKPTQNGGRKVKGTFNYK